MQSKAMPITFLNAEKTIIHTTAKSTMKQTLWKYQWNVKNQFGKQFFNVKQQFWWYLCCLTQ